MSLSGKKHGGQCFSLFQEPTYLHTLSCYNELSGTVQQGSMCVCVGEGGVQGDTLKARGKTQWIKTSVVSPLVPPLLLPPMFCFQRIVL